MIGIYPDQHLSHAEYLSRIDAKRQHSDIIDGLCLRIEELCAQNSTLVADNSNHKVECPVCECELHAEYDSDNQLFTIKVPQ